MTAEQLQHARASAWRHDGHGLLTGDDASAWLRDAGFALFLPRPAQIAAPAGSFVEATLGAANATPPPRAIETSTGLLHRMLAAGGALALNLLGMPGDQPDFVVTEETLPFLFALRGDREWARGPRGKSSPLVVEVWKLLHRDGAQTADQIKDKLGRHLTESAALRALTDLWTTLRIEPMYAADDAADDTSSEGTRWQLLEVRHEKAMTAGSAMAQGMALSALVSLYLQSAIAATGDEIEAFLAPLASRSRVREAVRGLHATRQLGVRHLGADEHFFVEGSLPDFGEMLPRELPHVPADLLPETSAPAELGLASSTGSEQGSRPDTGFASGLRIDALSEVETERERTVGEGRKRFVAQRGAGADERRSFGPSRPGGASFGGPRKTFGGKSFGGKSFGGNNFGGTSGGARKSFGAPGQTSGARGPAGPREGAAEARGPGVQPGDATAAKPFFAREPWKEDRRPARPGPDRESGPGTERRERPTKRPGAERPERPADRFPSSERKPSAPFRTSPSRGDRDDKPFPSRGGPRAQDARGPRGEGGTRPPRKTFAPQGNPDRRPFTPRDGSRPSPPDGEHRPFAPRQGGRPPAAGRDRKAFAAGGDRPTPSGGGTAFPPRESGRSFRPAGDRKPFSSRDDSRPTAPRGDRKPFAPRDGNAGERKPSAPREGKPFPPREGGRPFSPRNDRKPFAPREGGAPGRRTFAPRAGAPVGDGERRSFAPRDREDSPRRSGAEGSAPPKRFTSGEGRPSRPGAPAGPARPGGKRPRTSPFTSSGKPRAGVGATGRPGPRSVSAPAARAGRPGKPASGRKPGAPPRKPGAGGPGKGPGRGPERGPGRGPGA